MDLTMKKKFLKSEEMRQGKLPSQKPYKLPIDKIRKQINELHSALDTVEKNPSDRDAVYTFVKMIATILCMGFGKK